MSRREAYIVVAIVLALILCVVGGAAYYTIKSQAQLGQLLKDQGELIKQAQSKQDTAKKSEQQTVNQESSRVSDLAQALSRIASAKQQPVDLDDLARRIKEQIGTQATVQKPASSLPDAPSTVTLDAQATSNF